MRPWTKTAGAVDVVIAGGGPAGAMLGLLLARAGCDVVVLERHNDFLRDFRGDTIHPSTLETLDQLGLADAFLKLPHVQAPVMEAHVDGGVLRIPFDQLRTPFPFIAFVPQWDFLTFLTTEASRYPSFCLVMDADITGLIHEDGRIAGVRYTAPDGDHELRALLTVGADGRDSTTRDLAGLQVVATSPPMDVLWFRVTRRADEPVLPSLRLGDGRIVVLFDRGEYWQVAYVVRKGAVPPIDEIRRAVVELAPFLADRTREITDTGIRRLTVRSDRLRRWYAPGYLAIGDAAHAMSPVGGVGINLAIQDAVAAANVLWKPLRSGTLSLADLRRVQRRRGLPVRIVQAGQGLLHHQVLVPALERRGERSARAMRWATRWGRPLAGLVALGPFRPRVRTPALPASAR